MPQCRDAFPVVQADDDGDGRLYTDFTISAILGLTHEVNDDNVDHDPTTSSVIRETYETPRFPSFSGSIQYTQKSSSSRSFVTHK